MIHYNDYEDGGPNSKLLIICVLLCNMGAGDNTVVRILDSGKSSIGWACCLNLPGNEFTLLSDGLVEQISSFTGDGANDLGIINALLGERKICGKAESIKPSCRVQ